MNCNTKRRNVKARETHYLKQRVEDVAQQLAKRRHCAHAAQVTEEARNLNGPAYTALACAGVAVICPKHKAVVHSLDWPTFLAMVAQFILLATLVLIIFSVTASRFMRSSNR